MRNDPVVAVPMYFEVGSKRVFAAAFDWPGWCRSGKDEAGALVALAAAAPRYEAVAREAGLAFPRISHDSFHVVERLPGSATTEFGAPGSVAPGDGAPLPVDEAARLAALLNAVWVVFDRIVTAAPAELRKGPRGGGRDRDKIVEHVLGAEVMYARKLGCRLTQPSVGDRAAIGALRSTIVDTIHNWSDKTPVVDNGWPPRYAARRIAWHVVDHAWEIEDKSTLD